MPLLTIDTQAGNLTVARIRFCSTNAIHSRQLPSPTPLQDVEGMSGIRLRVGLHNTPGDWP